MSTESREEAIREAKRYVRDIVRNDWSFEFSTKPGAPPPTYPASPEPKEVLEWRLREYDSSGSEFEPHLSPLSPGSPTGFDLSSSSTSASGRRADRRRKRRRQLEEEMGCNGGLRTWVERRDAWTGAKSKNQILKTAEQPSILTSSTTSAAVVTPDTTTTTTDTEIQTPTSAEESSNLATKTEAALNIAEKKKEEQPSDGVKGEPSHHHADAAAQSTANPAENTLNPSSTETAITNPDTSAAATTTPGAFEDPLIPVVPSPIATSNPIRASITPTMYPSIYSKVVIQGLTPTVPINLADMTKAMVQGWKADGQWPPKPTSIVLPDDSLIRSSNAPKHPDTPAMISTPANVADKPPSSPESKRRSGIANTVRKVLHFSGFHPHPFHRRGSSSQTHVHPDDLAAAVVADGATTTSPTQPAGELKQ